MISFIVIGRNEEKNLERCFNSILSCIEANSLQDAEIIYVDSNSNDNSIEIAEKLEEIKIFKLIDKYNAAIGRNVGALESKGDILYFIDGDMEIMPDFIKYVVDEKGKLIHGFVSGVHIAVNFDSEGNKLGEKKYAKGNITKDQYFAETGGIFIIERKLWESVDGMKNKFKKSQDIDLALRLAKKGTLLLRKKETMNKHYTVPYKEKKRMWQTLFSNYLFYSNGLLIREHLFNKYIYRRLLKHNSTFLILVITLLGSVIFSTYYIIGVYLLLILLRSILRKGNTLNYIPYIIIKDIITLYSFCFFYPSNIKTSNVNYKKIK